MCPNSLNCSDTETNQEKVLWQSKFLFTGLLLIFLFPANAREIKPTGYFLQDSTKVGEIISYSLSVKYPRKMQVIFPDSNYIFLPFEYTKRIYFPTRSDSSTSFDSVVYFLSTFEIDAVQKLSLPVYVIVNGDSTPIFAQADSVFFKPVVKEIPEPVVLKEMTGYRKVISQFNYPYFILGSICLILIGVVLISIFAKPIQKRLKAYRLMRLHKNFVKKYTQSIGELRNSESADTAENLLFFWKEYMEKLEGIPYKKLTTREILEYEENNILHEQLRVIDRNIYGHKTDNHVVESFNILFKVSQERYERKKEEVLND